MSLQSDQPPTTLEQLEAAANSGDLSRLRLLRQRLGCTAAFGAVVDSAASGDRVLDRLCLLVANFGPGCLNCADSEGNTLAHLTVGESSNEAPMELIHEAAGDSLDCLKRRSDFNRYSTAHFAAANPCNAALKWLARVMGPKYLRGTAYNDQLPVHISAMRQGSDSMAVFKEALGASCFHRRDAMQRCAFHYAAMNRRGNGALRWLIDEIGPDPLTAPDCLGSTPVHLAAITQGTDSMDLLRENLGCQMFALEGEGCETVIHSAARNTSSSSALAWCIGELGPECLLTADPLGRMPIHMAALHQTEEAMRMIVDSLGHSGCLNLPDEEQRTAVHYAAMNAESNSAMRWIAMQLGPECLMQPDTDGNMAVHLAAQHQDADSLSFIRDSLGDCAFNLEGFNRRTMVHFAAENDSGAAIDWIVRHLGEHCLLVQDADGVTAATLAGYSE